jgi:hypothetical protein
VKRALSTPISPHDGPRKKQANPKKIIMPIREGGIAAIAHEIFCPCEYFLVLRLYPPPPSIYTMLFKGAQA